MTVVATFAIEGFPLVFGDLLLTGPSAASDRKVAVPTQGEVQDFFGSSGWAISGLTQKINLPSKECAIAWAGSWLGARSAISSLRRLAGSTALTWEKIQSCLTSDADLQNYPASFVGLLFELGELRQFRINSDEFQSPALGTVYVSGSGSLAIRDFSELLLNVSTRATGEPNIADTAIARALSLGGMLLQSEFSGGEAASTIRNMFGGGYEIAFYSNGEMQKLNEVTYVLWQALIQENGVKLSYPQVIIKQKYSGHFLLMRSARVETDATGNNFRIVDEQRHVITPMFDLPIDVPVGELADVSLQSRLICHCILVKLLDGRLALYTRIQRYSQSSDITITFEDKPGQLIFGLRQDTMSEIVQSLQHFRSPGLPSNSCRNG